ncbi:MAG: hypothetical protein QOJ00_2142, partial [Actinomycetota bacterium]
MRGLAPTPRRALRGYAPLAALLIVLAAFTTLVPTTGNEVIVAHIRTTKSGGGVGGVEADGGTTTGGVAAVGSGGTAASARANASTPVTGCADRKLQVPGFEYSPPCIAFAGNNGGATSKG